MFRDPLNHGLGGDAQSESIEFGRPKVVGDGANFAESLPGYAGHLTQAFADRRVFIQFSSRQLG